MVQIPLMYLLEGSCVEMERDVVFSHWSLRGCFRNFKFLLILLSIGTYVLDLFRNPGKAIRNRITLSGEHCSRKRELVTVQRHPTIRDRANPTFHLAGGPFTISLVYHILMCHLPGGLPHSKPSSPSRTA
jgi:hypothetical protein